MTSLSILGWSSDVLIGLLVICSCVFRKRLMHWLERSKKGRYGIVAVQALVPIGAAALATHFKIFEDPRASFTGPVVAFYMLLVAIYIGITVLNIAIKEKDQETIDGLKKELVNQGETHGKKMEIATASTVIAQNQFNWAVRARELGKAVVADRLRRMMTAPKIDGVSEIQRILDVLHSSMAGILKLEPAHRLRLMIYLPEDGYLQVIYAFDGENDKCVSGLSRSCMQINDPKGPQSVVTQLFHSDNTCTVISDCAAEDARKNGSRKKKATFSYLRHEQREHLRSMVAVKKIISYPVGKDVAILVMDTDQPRLFKDKDKAEIQMYCDEMLTRVEFELVWEYVRQRPADQPHPPVS